MMYFLRIATTVSATAKTTDVCSTVSAIFAAIVNKIILRGKLIIKPAAVSVTDSFNARKFIDVLVS
jgi:hypothetical protein